MSVKQIQSASRVLAALEAIAHLQPIGLSALSRHMGIDKSALQRVILTLVNEKWLRAAPGKPVRWELTPRLIAVAHAGMYNYDLRKRARSTLEALRNRLGETVILVVPDDRTFVILDVLECDNILRMAPRVGIEVKPRLTATGRAILPYLSPSRQADILGSPPDDTLLAEYAVTRKQGYAVSYGELMKEIANIAAPIFDLDGEPIGAVVAGGPTERFAVDQQERIGREIVEAARLLSDNVPAATP
jgi:DNA-binding IclR family transcriptional regulator